jgi:long-chain acyl-CoA synthetase
LSYFDDYFRTGDWGHKDREGYLYLTSRKKDLINVGGKKVSPMEVETLIQKVPGVLDCACVGIPDKEGYLGEVVKAYVVKETGSSTTFDEILSQITGKIEYYKLPVQWSWVEEIPKTQNGKILRHLLV